jgi:hypothetical protein
MILPVIGAIVSALLLPQAHVLDAAQLHPLDQQLEYSVRTFGMRCEGNFIRVCLVPRNQSRLLQIICDTLDLNWETGPAGPWRIMPIETDSNVWGGPALSLALIVFDPSRFPKECACDTIDLVSVLRDIGIARDGSERVLLPSPQLGWWTRRSEYLNSITVGGGWRVSSGSRTTPYVSSPLPGWMTLGGTGAYTARECRPAYFVDGPLRPDHMILDAHLAQIRVETLVSAVCKQRERHARILGGLRLSHSFSIGTGVKVGSWLEYSASDSLSTVRAVERWWKMSVGERNPFPLSRARR